MKAPLVKPVVGLELETHHPVIEPVSVRAGEENFGAHMRRFCQFGVDIAESDPRSLARRTAGQETE